ncbi:MAG TPA: hypothetical protein VHW01_11955, partial [Polyangiaceae bacterium]|nr:hypothetical protein [Polyangiaceae bacterium]
MTTAIKATLCLSAASAALLACVACSGPGNSGLNPPDEALIDEMPWLNGGVPHLDESDPTKPVIKTSTLPAYPAIGQNLVDEGSAPITDCYKEALYDFAPWVETGEPIQVAQAGGNSDPGNLTGLAIRWAGADDNTRGSWRTPGFATWYPGLAISNDPNNPILNPIIWGTPAQSTADMGTVSPFSAPYPGASRDANGIVQPGLAPNCNRNPDGTPKAANNYVIHMRGAGFRYYGGNIAHIMAGDNYVKMGGYDYTDCPTDVPGKPSLCHPAPVALKGETVPSHDSAGFPLLPTKSTTTAGTSYELGALHTYLDVSGYEGVSFWARRGPDSMGTLLVTIADKYTSDDMNRQNEQFCRRIFGCYSECQNGSICSKTDAETDAVGSPLYRCFDPKNGKIPSPDPSNVSAA